jgi:hypothetical protein
VSLTSTERVDVILDGLPMAVVAIDCATDIVALWNRGCRHAGSERPPARRAASAAAAEGQGSLHVGICRRRGRGAELPAAVRSFIQKPFTPQALALKVREVLDTTDAGDIAFYRHG